MIITLEDIWLGNSLRDWMTALGLALCINLVVGVTKWVVARYLARYAERTESQVDDAIVVMVKRTKQWLIFGITLMIGTRYLDLPPKIDHVLIHTAVLSGGLQVGLWLSAGLNVWINRYRSTTTDLAATTSLGALHFIARLVVWTLVILITLDNLGFNVSAMVAGLGVSGIAVALAVQNILGDLFASLSIVIDKPFVVGDSITVDNLSGTVEHVGLKTTRVRSSTGEEIIFSNGDLLKTRIRNMKRMQERKMVFTFGVVYEIDAKVLATIPDTVKRIIEATPRTRFDRAHFKGFGASSLDFEVAFWMRTADYMASLDAQQQINLGLFEAFAEQGIAFAYPTQTLIVQGYPTSAT